MRYTTFIVLAAYAACAGCDPISHESVTLQLPGSAEEVMAKSAVELISEVMTNTGFTQRAPAFSNATIVASFQGSGRLGSFVYHTPGRIEIVMQEMGRFKSRPEAIKARDELKRRLGEKFGKEKVGE